VNAFLRLLRYAKPYKGRLAWAVLAMVIYAIASALLAVLIKTILDQVPPTGAHLASTAAAVVAL